jgi:hypothetical protein
MKLSHVKVLDRLSLEDCSRLATWRLVFWWLKWKTARGVTQKGGRFGLVFLRILFWVSELGGYYEYVQDVDFSIVVQVRELD